MAESWLTGGSVDSPKKTLRTALLLSKRCPFAWNFFHPPWNFITSERSPKLVWMYDGKWSVVNHNFKAYSTNCIIGINYIANNKECQLKIVSTKDLCNQCLLLGYASFRIPETQFSSHITFPDSFPYLIALSSSVCTL